jgi:hypothetical protein
MVSSSSINDHFEHGRNRNNSSLVLYAAYSEAFSSEEDETSTSFSRDSNSSDNSNLNSSGSVSISSWSGSHDYSTFSSFSGKRSTSSTDSSSDCVAIGKESSLSHFENYCKRRQRRVRIDKVCDEVLPCNPSHAKLEIVRSESQESIQSFAKRTCREAAIEGKKNKSPAIMVKGIKVPKNSSTFLKLGTEATPTVKAPTSIFLSTGYDEVSALSDPAVQNNAVGVLTSGMRSVHRERMDSLGEIPKNEYVRDSHSFHGTDQKTNEGLKNSGKQDNYDNAYSDIMNEDLSNNCGIEVIYETNHNSCTAKGIKARSKYILFPSIRSRIKSKSITAEKTYVDAVYSEKSLKTFNGEYVKPKRTKKYLLRSIVGKLKKRDAMKLNDVEKNFDTSKGEDETSTNHYQNSLMIRDDLEINTDGSVSNHKIVYSKFEGDPTVDMKLITLNEDLMPDSNSSRILVRVEVRRNIKIICIV